MVDPVKDRKAALRRSLRAWRRALDPATARAWSASVCGHVAGLPEWRQARTVLLYRALPGEVDLSELEAVLGHRRLVLPVVVAKGRPLVAREATHLREGAFGIIEPGPQAQEVPLPAIDLVVVPGLAFDGHGGRLGQGGGFYDRTLVDTGATRLAVAFSRQLVDRVPSHAHDLCMDLVVTERGVVWRRAL